MGEGWGEGNKPKACLPASENVQYLVAKSIGASFMRTIMLCFDKANRTYAVGRLKSFQTAFGFIFQSLIHVLRMALALS